MDRSKREKGNDLWKWELGGLVSGGEDGEEFNVNDVKGVRVESGKSKGEMMICGLGLISIDGGGKVIVGVGKDVDVILRN
ncbi:hypothetical protein [Staphylococcus epidermidis]|uniref:hypothetical protein n=1 Tax=Staphylococcus epidermidis TaxID=1282 RepID=UPI0037D9C428